MQPPRWEVADLIHVAGQRFIDQNSHWLTGQHLKVLRAIEQCRTASLGGHLDECPQCGYRAISFNSCRDRHCPKCQANARERWLEARRKELLPVRYVHVVFTVPRGLVPLAMHNKKIFYDLLFRTTADTLRTIAADPKHLGADIGFFSVLHTWTQKLQFHPHIHCVVPSGGLSRDRSRWVHSRDRFFLPVEVLGRLFRGKLRAALKRAYTQGQLKFPGTLRPIAQPNTFAAFLRPFFAQDWVVYCKPPFAGPEHVLKYLGSYTHRIAISNHRIIDFSQDQVTFRWRDSANGNKQRKLKIPVTEFLRRFFLHVLPYRFVRIRHYGFLSNRRRRTFLALCLQLLATASVLTSAITSDTSSPAFPWKCPRCGSKMTMIQQLEPDDPLLRSPPQSAATWRI
jgi:predicted Zn-ribbon and HTH transcriptional regulator